VPVVLNLIERLILLTLNQGPGLMLDVLGAQAFRAVCVAVVSRYVDDMRARVDG